MKTHQHRTHVASSRIALVVGGALATVLALGGCGAHGSGEAVANTNAAVQKSSGGTGGPERLVLRLFHDQDMNEKQESQLADIRDNVTSQWNSMYQTIAADVPALRAELTKPTPDAVRIHALADQALAIYGQMTHSVIDQALALHATLSDSQRASLVVRGTGSHQDAARDLQSVLSFARTRATPELHFGVSALAGQEIVPEERFAVPALTGRETLNAASIGAGRPATMVLRLFHDSAMNQQQEIQLQSIRANLKLQRKALNTFIRNSTPTLLTELGKPTPDAAKVHAIADQALALYAQMTHSAVDRTLALQSTLSPAQRATLTR